MSCDSTVSMDLCVVLEALGEESWRGYSGESAVLSQFEREWSGRGVRGIQGVVVEIVPSRLKSKPPGISHVLRAKYFS